jgi:hypothetical protein
VAGEMEESVVAFIGFLGVILGVGIQEFRRWRESKEVYYRMIFQKRLEVHQKAVELCHNLYTALNIDSAKTQEATNDFQDWLAANCLYLDSNSRKAIRSLIGYARLYAQTQKRREPSVEAEKVWTQWEKTIEILARGVGVKYLPDLRNLEKG